jgi:hypothetical protein
MFVNDMFEKGQQKASKEPRQSETEFGYRKLDPLIHKARQKYPLASNDTEALALFIADKEEADVKDLEDKVGSVNQNAQTLIRRQQQVLQKQNKELDAIDQELDATKTDNLRQEKDIEQLVKSVNDANARYAAQEERFRDLTARVAAQKLTQTDVDAANIAKELERSDDARSKTFGAQQIVRNDVHEGNEWDISNAEFYKELLVLLSIPVGIMTASVYSKAKNVMAKYNALQIMKALDQKDVVLSREQVQELKTLIKQFDQAIVQNKGTEAKSIAQQVQQLAGTKTESREWDEGDTEPPNNFAVYINGKKWKVFKGHGQFAGDHKQLQHHRQLQNWAQAKSQATGKEWKVYVTGEQATQEGVAHDKAGNPIKRREEVFMVVHNGKEVAFYKTANMKQAYHDAEELVKKFGGEAYVRKVERVTESTVDDEIEKHLMEMRHAGYDITEGHGSYYCSTKKRMVQRKGPKQSRSSK